MENKNVQNIIAALKATELKFVDNHKPSRECDNTASKFVLFTNYAGEEFVCPVYNYTVCCLNPIFVDEDGKPYLSTGSVGGLVYNGDLARFNREQNSDRVSVVEIKF